GSVAGAAVPGRGSSRDGPRRPPSQPPPARGGRGHDALSCPLPRAWDLPAPSPACGGGLGWGQPARLLQHAILHPTPQADQATLRPSPAPPATSLHSAPTSHPDTSDDSVN